MKERAFNMGETLMYGAVSIFVFGEIFQLDQASDIYKLIALVSITFLVIKVVFENYQIKEYINMVIILFVSLFCYLHSGAVTVVISALFIVSAKEIDIKKMFKFIFYEQIICFSVIIFLGALGVRNSNKILIARMIGGDFVRYSLGFEHANQLHMYFFCIVVLFLFVFYTDIRVLHTLMILVLDGILYYFSKSRTGFVITILTVFGMLLIRKAEEKQIQIPLCTALIVPICTGATLYTTIFYSGNGWMAFFNKLLQGRISNANYFYQLNGLSLLGKKILADGGSDLIIDNSYALMMMKLGIVYLIIFNIVYIILVKQIILSADYSAIFIILAFALYGITEGFLSNIFLNYSLFFMAWLLYDNEIIHKPESRIKFIYR